MENDRDELYGYLLSRGVTRLCHFTKTKHLVHILTSDEGILATQFIKADVKKQNDRQRYDGATDHVCCSIEYPNCWYWRRVKENDEDAVFNEWVILCIDLNIVKYNKIKFCPCNAASGYGRYIKDDVSAFDCMFDGRVTVGRGGRSAAMLSCCPTDDQAEVLIYRNVPLRFLNKIIVGNEKSADNINAILKTLGIDLPVFIAPDVCNTNWSSMVRRGERPAEELYNG